MRLSGLLALQEQWATKKVFVFLIAVYFIFPFYLLPQILPEGRPLDLFIYYSPAEAYQLISSYGEANRLAYIKGSATIDMAYPLIYSIFLSLVLTFFISRLYPKESGFQYLRMFPFTIMLADFCENIAIISMLSNFPEQNILIASIAGGLTFIKWALFVLVLPMIVYFSWCYYQKKKQALA